MPSLVDEMLFAVLPYITIALFIGGLIYRGIVRPLEWSSRASGFFERPSIGIASLALHWGIIFLIVAHLFGLAGTLLPSAALVRVFYWMGAIAGSLFLFGVAAALIRRIVVREMRAMSRAEDYILLVFLLVIPSIALYQSLVLQVFGVSAMVGDWVVSLFKLSPEVGPMAGLTLITKMHITLVLLFISYFPYTKMVHVLALPWRYVYRPYHSIRMYRRMVR